MEISAQREGDSAQTDPGSEVALVRALGQFATTWVRAISATDDRSLTAASVLANLARLGPVRLGSLAALEGVRQPTMTELVSRLERDGLVQRRAGPGDRRAVSVALTDAGRRVVEGRRQRRDRVLRQALELLTAEQRANLLNAASALIQLTEATSKEASRS